MKRDNYINFDDIPEEELPFPKDFDHNDDQDDLFLVEDLDDEIQDEINYLKEEPPEDYESSNDDFDIFFNESEEEMPFPEQL